MMTANEQASRFFRTDYCPVNEVDSSHGAEFDWPFQMEMPKLITDDCTWHPRHVGWRRTERKEQIVYADGCVMDVFMDKPVYRVPAIMVRA